MSKIISTDSLDKSSYEYFSEVLRRLNGKFDDEDDKSLYIKNVMKATKGVEIKLSTHGKLSHAVEELLSQATSKQLVKFHTGFSQDYSTMCTHQVASHVMQRWLQKSLQHVSATNDKSEANNSKLVEEVVEFTKWVVSELEELLQNNYACHVICCLLETLSGCPLSEISHKKQKSFNSLPNSVETPSEFKNELWRLIKKIKHHDNITGLISNVGSSLILQTILLICFKIKHTYCEKLIKKLISPLFNHSEELGYPLTNRNVTPLIEKVIDVAAPEQFTDIQKKYFKGNLKKLVLCPAANYVVQHLIKRCPSKEQFEVLYEELADLWSEISDVGHLGVIVAMSDTCKRLNVSQANFTQRIAQLLDCWEPKTRKFMLVPLLSRWLTFDQYDKRSLKINYHGSLILQNMFLFQKPIVICDSLMQMEIEDLLHFCCDPCGSHIIDSFVHSKTVGEKRRQSLIEKLKGKLTSLSSDKFGSLCVETLWRSSDIKSRLEMVEELVANKNQLRNKYGYFVYNLCQLDLFKSQPKQWKENQIKSGKRNFNEISFADGK